MSYNKYFEEYVDSISNLLKNIDKNLINETVDLIKKKAKDNGTVFIVGNGGSSSIASHVSVDFVKSAKIRSTTFNNSNLITCFANDYDYENWVKEAIKAYCFDHDLIILISSSGQSQNMINAAKYCKDNNIDLITLSGFKKNNELKNLGKINYYIESNDYNYVEMAHHIILVSIVDIIAKKNL
tara:strand:+ start:302 stop:850 length:549 start_codon:yes stop_codon:yes gene_type:complete